MLISLEFCTTINPIKWITVYLGANVYNYKISGHLDVLGTTSDVNNADWVYSINMNTTFNLGNRFLHYNKLYL